MVKHFLIAMGVFFTSLNMVGQNTLPSCVITAPHCNAYFIEGSNITINVYASDAGGTYKAGTVAKVEFFNGEIKLGEATSATTNTYSYLWSAVPAGTYTITAKATDNDNAISTSAGVIISVGTAAGQSIGMSAKKGKYLANIVPGSAGPNYKTYWNGVTAENGCKWGYVEANRDVMDWTVADNAYNFAKTNNLMFRYHALVWGRQYPSWITTLSPADFQAEMEEYMAAVAERYPLIDQIDVLNENMYLNTWDGKEHAEGTPYFRAGLGGPGVTGYDWVIWLFEKARFYFPNAKLVMNDFELENNTDGINEMLDVVKVLRDRNLIDGFGTQAHYFNVDGINATDLKNSLNLMDNSGVPVYVTELDLKGKPESEAGQLASYTSSFPVYWDYPAVAGISLWGYIEGATWAAGTGILNSDGSERSAMTWLKTYMENLPDVGYPFDNGGLIEPPSDNILENGEFDSDTYGWEINNYNTGKGTMLVVTDAGMSGANALEICTTATGANWEVQISQNAPLEAGKNYLISLIAKAETPRTISLAMQMGGDPYTIYLEEQLALTTSNQSFKFMLTPTISDISNKLKFFVGLEASCLTIDSVVFKEDIGISALDETENSTILVYPNPVTNGKVRVSDITGEMISYVELIDIQGKLVKTVHPKELNAEIEVSDLKKGMYYLRIHSEKSVNTHKILIW